MFICMRMVSIRVNSKILTLMMKHYYVHSDSWPTIMEEKLKPMQDNNLDKFGYWLEIRV